MAVLDYKAGNIIRAEREMGYNFIATLQGLQNNLGLHQMVFLLMAGGLNETEAETLIDSGIDKAIEAIMEGIGNAGFLPAETRAEIKNSMPKNLQKKTKEPSQPTGEKTEA